MDRQIGDMLNFVKGERREKKLVTVNVIIDQIKSLSETWVHPVEFKLSDSVLNCEALDSKSSGNSYLLSDVDSLVGAINNLIDNAIDASASEMSVFIEFDISEHNQLEIAVKDVGCGIDDQLKKKIFEPFYSSKNNGNGLGLAIVQGVVIEHQGKISVWDNVKKGSVFKIELPLFSNTGKLKKNHSIIRSAHSRDNSRRSLKNIDDKLILQGVPHGH